MLAKKSHTARSSAGWAETEQDSQGLMVYLSEQPRHRESVENTSTHDDRDFKSKCKADQLVSVALDKVSI